MQALEDGPTKARDGCGEAAGPQLSNLNSVFPNSPFPRDLPFMILIHGMFLKEYGFFLIFIGKIGKDCGNIGQYSKSRN